MKRLLTGLLVLAFAVCAGFAARTWLFSAVRIAGSSMSDTLISGDVILITRFGSPDRDSIMQRTIAIARIFFIFFSPSSYIFVP